MNRKKCTIFTITFFTHLKDKINSSLEILIAIIVTVFLFLLIWKIELFQTKNIKKSVVLGIFAIKILSGLTLTALYSFYYSDGELSGDTAHYFEDGKVLNAVFSESPSDYFTFLFTVGDRELIEKRLKETEHWTRGEMDQFNDNRFIVRINSVISFFSWNILYVHILVFIFFSLAGSILFYKAIEGHIESHYLLFFLLICLFPSMLFWTSSILKESLLVLGFGLLAYASRNRDTGGWKIFGLMLLGLFILLNTKIYFLICLIPAAIVYFTFGTSWRRNLILSGSAIVLGYGAIYITSYTNNFNILSFISQKQQDFIQVGKGGVYFMDEKNFYRLDFAENERLKIKDQNVKLLEDIQVEVKPFGASDYLKDSVLTKGQNFLLYDSQVPSRSMMDIPRIENSWWNLVRYSPVYFANVMFLPMPWSEGSGLKWLNFFENIALYVLIILAVLKRRPKNKIDQKLLFASLFFILSLYLLIGATTPVIGAFVRYKTPAFLIWILFFLSIIDFKKITLKSIKN